jgi:hypothetical protein
MNEDHRCGVFRAGWYSQELQSSGHGILMIVSEVE